MSTETARSPILDVTTEELETKPFLVDGEEYELYTIAHLDPAKEAQVTATYARQQRIVQRLARAKNDQEAEREAGKLRPLRVRLITLMTSVPKDTAENWNPRVQGKVMEVISDEILDVEEEDEEGDSD